MFFSHNNSVGIVFSLTTSERGLCDDNKDHIHQGAREVVTMHFFAFFGWPNNMLGLSFEFDMFYVSLILCNKWPDSLVKG